MLMGLAFGFLSAFGAPAGTASLFNDTGVTAYGLRVYFDQPVTIVQQGDGFANWTTEDEGSTILFQDGDIPPWGDFYFFWEPAEAALTTHTWVLVAPSAGELVPEIPR